MTSDSSRISSSKKAQKAKPGLASLTRNPGWAKPPIWAKLG